MKTKKKENIKKFILILSIVLMIFCVCFIGFFTYFFNKFVLDKNKLTSLNNGVIVASATTGNESLYNTNRSIVEIETLPDYVLNAFIAVEDKRFYSHNGYDLKRIVKAGFINLKSKDKCQGASTISQQLIKNALLSSEKTYSRKFEEIILAMKMEKEFSKEEILEMYLNTIYFGSNAYGIENASHTYFDKSAKDLTLDEACCLAGIIKSPYKFSPKYNYENCKKRRNLVAKLMLEQNYINQEDYKLVINKEIELNNSNFDYSYEEETIYEACKLLDISERELINQEYQIISYKDEKLQEQVIEITNNVLKDYPNSDSLTIVLDNAGKVISYYANSNFNLHNAKCQVASTLKPLAVYLPCIQHNILTPVTQILDEPIDYSGYQPKNADNTFHGYVSSREALAKSLNIPAVKLLECVGLDKAKQTLTNLGVNIEKNDLNLSLALGSTKKGVDIFTLASAYSTIANQGTHNSMTFIDKILDKNGKIVYSNQNYSEQILKPEDCFLLTDILKDTSIYGTAKRFDELKIPIAAKTGTNNVNGKNTDILNVAYTTNHTILTWITNLKNKALDEKMLSSVEPTEINKQILKNLYISNKPKDFTIPQGIKKLPYDSRELKNHQKIYSPSENTPERYIEYDYFKIDNPPTLMLENKILDPKVEITKFGAKISLDTYENNDYVLHRVIKNKSEILTKDFHQKDFSYLDNDIFNYDEIGYYYSLNGKDSAIVTIRPKDYLINLLDKEITSGKKKWYV